MVNVVPILALWYFLFVEKFNKKIYSLMTSNFLYMILPKQICHFFYCM